MGTTKLTRKEILAEDPVHEAIIQLIEFFQTNGKKVGILAAVIVVVAVGIYGGLQYLDNRQMQAQEQLGKGMDFFHAQVSVLMHPTIPLPRDLLRYSGVITRSTTRQPKSFPL